MLSLLLCSLFHCLLFPLVSSSCIFLEVQVTTTFFFFLFLLSGVMNPSPLSSIRLSDEVSRGTGAAFHEGVDVCGDRAV